MLNKIQPCHDGLLLLSLVKVNGERSNPRRVTKTVAWEMGVSSLRIVALDDLDNRRIANFFENYHPVVWLYYADWPAIVQCKFYPIFFLAEPTSFGLLEIKKKFKNQLGFRIHTVLRKFYIAHSDSVDHQTKSILSYHICVTVGKKSRTSRCLWYYQILCTM